MNKKNFFAANLSLLILFYILRCTVMNVNLLFTFLIAIEGIIISIVVLTLLIKRSRTKENLISAFVHIAGIAAIFLMIGHMVSITTLYVVHHKTIEVFRNNQEKIPVADRTNGGWILDEKDFKISDNERRALKENYEKSIPCRFEDGYCYFELGGYRNNSGGYYYALRSGLRDPMTFGYDRISKLVNLVGGWGFYR